MAYGVSNVLWGNTVVYPSDSLASCFYFLLFLMCHYAVMLSSRGQSGLEAKSLSSSSASASKRLFPISGPLEPSLCIYIGFWIWALGILQYPSRTRSQAVARIADRTASQHLWGHVTSSVTWPFDSPYAISYWWSFGTESLSPDVFELLRSERIGVTSLTNQGHVTSSVTWPFDSPCAISYWWSFGTKPLSVTVSEIFNVKCNAWWTWPWYNL